jgi:hypothetical protein
MHLYLATISFMASQYDDRVNSYSGIGKIEETKS